MPIAIAPKSATHREPWRSTIILQRIPATADAKAIAVYPKDRLPRLHPNSAINGFKNITAGMPENEIQCLFHDNAIKYYNPL